MPLRLHHHQASPWANAAALMAHISATAPSLAYIHHPRACRHRSHTRSEQFGCGTTHAKSGRWSAMARTGGKGSAAEVPHEWQTGAAQAPGFHGTGRRGNADLGLLTRPRRVPSAATTLPRLVVIPACSRCRQITMPASPAVDVAPGDHARSAPMACRLSAGCRPRWTRTAPITWYGRAAAH